MLGEYSQTDSTYHQIQHKFHVHTPRFVYLSGKRALSRLLVT